MAVPTILVTGANGQLGKEFQRLAPAYSQYHFIFLSKDDLPIEDAEKVNAAFTKNRPQYCINCAAYTAVDKAEEEKDLAFQINGEAVGILAKACMENNCQFIHISTDYVFDGASLVPYREDDPVNPQSVYGASKLEGEQHALHLNPSSIIIRTSWVYSEFGKNFVKTMLRLMKEKPEINVVNDQVGAPTYAADLAEAILLIITNCQLPVAQWKGGVYHYSNKGIISWFDFAMAIKEMINSNCKVNPIPTSQYPTPAKRPSYSLLDTSKIQGVLNIPIKPWKDSLATCLKQLR